MIDGTIAPLAYVLIAIMLCQDIRLSREIEADPPRQSRCSWVTAPSAAQNTKSAAERVFRT